MTYRYPLSFRPPLAFGGHCWALGFEAPGWLSVGQCVGCGITVPRWSLSEHLWSAFAPAVCPAAVRALTAGGRTSEDRSSKTRA
jgi:hypothetical protein